MNPKVRLATLEDSRAVAGLMTELGYPTGPKQMAARLQRIAGHHEYETFVAEHRQEVVGMIGVRRGLNYARDGVYGRIVALVVADNWRGRGIGAGLVRAAEEWLLTQGAHAVIVNTRTDRSDAQAFYERLGYTRTGYRFGKTDLGNEKGTADARSAPEGNRTGP